MEHARKQVSVHVTPDPNGGYRWTVMVTIWRGLKCNTFSSYGFATTETGARIAANAAADMLK